MKTRVSTQGRSGQTAQPMKQLRDLMAGLVLTLLGLTGRPAAPSLITLAYGWLPPWVAHLGSTETGLSQRKSTAGRDQMQRALERVSDIRGQIQLTTPFHTTSSGSKCTQRKRKRGKEFAIKDVGFEGQGTAFLEAVWA